MKKEGNREEFHAKARGRKGRGGIHLILLCVLCVLAPLREALLGLIRALAPLREALPGLVCALLLIVAVHGKEGFQLGNHEVLEIGVELVKDTDNLVNLVIARLKEHRAFAVFQPFGVYAVSIAEQLDNPVVQALAAFFQRGDIAFGDMNFLPEFFLGQAEGVAQFKKAAADGLIHGYKPTKKTAEGQGFACNGLTEDIVYPQKV